MATETDGMADQKKTLWHEHPILAGSLVALPGLLLAGYFHLSSNDPSNLNFTSYLESTGTVIVEVGGKKEIPLSDGFVKVNYLVTEDGETSQRRAEVDVPVNPIDSPDADRARYHVTDVTTWICVAGGPCPKVEDIKSMTLYLRFDGYDPVPVVVAPGPIG